MEIIESKGRAKFVTIGLKPGEKLLESIQEVVKSCDIRNGAVVSGVGTLKSCNLHYVKTSKFPPENSYYTIEKPLEIASISGLIADYEPHLHIAVGCEDKETYIGHLEKDSIVLYLAEVLIMRLDNMVMKREIDPEYNIPFLKEGI